MITGQLTGTCVVIYWQQHSECWNHNVYKQGQPQHSTWNKQENSTSWDRLSGPKLWHLSQLLQELSPCQSQQLKLIPA